MTRYLSLAEFWHLAEDVTRIDVATLIKSSRVDLEIGTFGRSGALENTRILILSQDARSSA